MPSILSLEKISKRFGAVVVADNIDLTLLRGEALGIIGPNGAGKTTLFGIVSGTVAPDAGRVVFEGHDVTPSQLVPLVALLDQPPFYIHDTATDRSLSISLGKHLLKLKDRTFATVVVRKSGKNPSTGSTLWRLERLEGDDAHVA